jgi:hypothetical protein
MSAVRATNAMSSEPQALAADVQAMQDVLYDILATGIDTEQNDVPSSEIERFLHEHARSPKSLDEFRAFFALHGLSVRARPTHQPPALVLPPIERVERPSTETVTVTILEDDADDDSGAEADTGTHRTASGTWAKPDAANRSRLAVIMLSVGACCLLAALGFLLMRGFDTLLVLRAELDRSVTQELQSRAEIQALRERAARLESSATATGELLQRMDQKNDALIQSLLAAEHERESHRHH